MAQGQNPLQTPQFPAGSRFETVCLHVLGIEGGYSAYANDHGGPTNWGISLRFLVDQGKLDIDRDGHPDLDLNFDGDLDGADVRLLTEPEAMNVYWLCIWRPLGLDRLPLHLDAAVFDQAVNGGRGAAVKMLQRSGNALRLTDPVDVDGVLGAKTAAAVGTIQRLCMGNALLMRYRAQAEARYRSIAAIDPSQKAWLDGWINRARRLGDV